VVREHAGKIDAENRTGGGACFTIHLPAANPRAAPAGGMSGAGAGAALEGHSVLLVDDEESIRELILNGLTARGLRVDCVASAEEALRQMENTRYDAVICDWNLPGLNGGELVERLRRHPQSAAAAFLLMTGDLVDAQTLEQLETRGVMVLQKPFRIAQLAAALGWALEVARSRAH
jgi:CheY-like chemotaxis protein